jgi:hypothetical protein
MDNYALGNPGLHSHISALAVPPSFVPTIPKNVHVANPPLRAEQDLASDPPSSADD